MKVTDTIYEPIESPVEFEYRQAVGVLADNGELEFEDVCRMLDAAGKSVIDLKADIAREQSKHTQT